MFYATIDETDRELTVRVYLCNRTLLATFTCAATPLGRLAVQQMIELLASLQ